MMLAYSMRILPENYLTNTKEILIKKNKNIFQEYTGI